MSNPLKRKAFLERVDEASSDQNTELVCIKLWDLVKSPSVSTSVANTTLRQINTKDL